MSAFVVDRLIENDQWLCFMRGTDFFQNHLNRSCNQEVFPAVTFIRNKKSLAYEDENKKKDVGLWIRNHRCEEKVFVAGYTRYRHILNDFPQRLFQRANSFRKEAVIW
jgi:hypothetical protein